MTKMLTSPVYTLKTSFFSLASVGMMLLACFLAGKTAALWCLGISIAVAGVRLLLASWGSDALQRYGTRHEFSPHLGKTIAELCGAADREVKDIPLFDYNFSERYLKNLGPEKRRKQKYKIVFNAGAGFNGHDYILVSEPVLKLLDDAEEKSVLGHEFAHMVLHHAAAARVASMINMTTCLACLCFIVAEAAHTGKTGVEAVAAAAIAATLWARFIYSDGALLFARKLPETASYAETSAKYRARQRLRFHYAALLVLACDGILSWLDAGFAFCCAAALSVVAAGLLFSLAACRSREFQADQGAVALQASPLALITGLRKLEYICNRWTGMSEEQAAAQKTSTAWTLSTLLSSHPPNGKRYQRLARAARRLNIPEDAIAKAVAAPIRLTEEFDVTHETTEKLIRRYTTPRVRTH